RAYDLENAYYTLGSDIVVNHVDVLNPNYKQSVEAIEGVEAASYVGILELSNTESDLVYTIRILGIELDNFSKVAYQEDEYTNNRQIENVIPSITNFTDVIGQRDQMDLLNLGDNTTFVIKNWADVGPDVVRLTYPVSFVDFYQYWPTLFTVQPSTISKEIHIGLMANISLPFHITRYQSDVDGKLLVKVKEGYSINEVAQTIESETRHDTNNVEEMLLISSGTLKSTVLFGSLNTSFTISMLISAATLVIMMTVQAIEREKELAVMKSLGINFRQLFTFFFSEALIVLIFTMIIGVGLGFSTSIMIMKVLRIGSVYPPHENIFPLANIAWTTLVIFGCGLISTIIPIIINSRKKIGGALKSI
ncbi:MAG: FtsX-like permease family protein, partial [Candidatus Heimdallarchaeota archaeon]